MTTMTIASVIAGAPLVLGLALFRAAARGDRALHEMGLLEPATPLDPGSHRTTATRPTTPGLPLRPTV